MGLLLSTFRLIVLGKEKGVGKLEQYTSLISIP